jgi:hypothetical protein
MFEIKTAEKIETIILCYLGGRQTTEGKFGKLEPLARGYRVTADGITVIAFTVRGGWQVNATGGRTGTNRYLIEAIDIAINQEEASCS